LAFLTQNKAKLFKSLSITLVFEKTPLFPPKIVKNSRKFTTSTPGHPVFYHKNAFNFEEKKRQSRFYFVRRDLRGVGF
jgi:hypothetical protein